MSTRENGIIALDVGGTFIKYGLYDFQCNELFQDKEPTKTGTDEFFNQICTIVTGLFERYKGIAGIAISMPGFVDPATGANTDFSIPEGLTTHNLKSELSGIYNCHVSIENDCNCAAIAERDYGAGMDCGSFAMITIGTGIGGAIVIDGKLLQGSNFKAGELGFFLLGREKEVGATSLLVQKVSDYTGRRVDGEYIIEHLNDEAIKSIYDSWLEDLAIVIGNTAAVLDPERVLIGGGISASQVFVNDLRNRVFELFPFEKYMEILPCKFRNDAGKIGAVGAFIEEYCSKTDC